MRGLIRSAALAGAALSLAACAGAPRPITMQVDGEALAYAGSMQAGVGPGTVTLARADGKVNCEGVALVAYATPGCSDNGSIRLECSDGREINGDWQIGDDCISGSGSGSDDDGNAVSFVLGDPAERELSARATSPAGAAVKQFGLRIGGGYTVSFSAASPSDATIVFEDASAGLVIRRDDRDAAEMVLAKAAPHSDQQGFAVVPAEPGRARVKVVHLRSMPSAELRVHGLGMMASGVPVMNDRGHVLGMTRVVDGELRLFEASRLRRYLAMIDPAFAAAEPVDQSADSLAMRIIPR